MIRIRPLLVVAAILCAAGLGNAATADAAELLYGVDTQNRLVTFNGDTPTAISRVPFTGLPAGEQIVGLDVRPANKQVVALSSASRLYRIDVATGAATVIGAAPFTPALSGASFGFDSTRPSTGFARHRIHARTCACTPTPGRRHSWTAP